MHMHYYLFYSRRKWSCEFQLSHASQTVECGGIRIQFQVFKATKSELFLLFHIAWLSTKWQKI